MIDNSINKKQSVESKVVQTIAVEPIVQSQNPSVFGQNNAAATKSVSIFVAPAAQGTQNTTSPIFAPQAQAPNFFNSQPAKYTIKKGDTLSHVISAEISRVLPNLNDNEKKALMDDLVLKIKNSKQLPDVNKLKLGQEVDLSSTRENIIKYKNQKFVPESVKGLPLPVINEEIGYKEPVIEKPKTHMIQKGENLNKIAHEYGISVKELLDRNGIKDANLIKRGQILNLGTNADVKNAPKVEKLLQAIKPQPQVETPVKLTSGLYQVKPGDSLYKIAREQNISVDELCRLNGISKTYNLGAGESLKLKESNSKEIKRILGQIATDRPKPQKWETPETIYKYNVMSGDNSQKIAHKFREVTGSKASNTDIMVAIHKNNPDLNFNRLHSGDIINIPFDVPITDSIYNRHKAILADAKIKLSPVNARSLEKFIDHYKKNKQRYDKVADVTGYPPELIAALHFRESVEPDKFNTYMHNGAKVGTVSKIVPKGIKFDTWEESAIDLLNNEDNKRYKNMYRFDKDSKDTIAMVSFAERHNGGGYAKQGINSPYVYSGTDKYVAGKFDADKHFNPNAVDKQLGIYVMLEACEKI